MGSFFAYLYNLNRRFRIVALVVLIVFVGLSAKYALQLKLSEDITRIFPANKEMENMTFVFSNSKLLDKVVFMVSVDDTNAHPDPSVLVSFTNSFVDSLNSIFVPNEIASVNTGPDNKMILKLFDEVFNNLPVFLEEQDYKKIDSLLTDSSIRYTLKKEYQTLISPASFATKGMIKKDPLNVTFLALNKFRKFQVSDNFELYNNHIITKDKRYLLLFITPAHPTETGLNQKLFNRIDKLILETRNRFSDAKIDVNYFGSTVVAAGNASQIKKDIVITVSLAALALILLISLFFRSWKSFFLIMLPVLFGALVAIASLAILEREVSAISLGIGSVLLGISVDFALHTYSHYRQYGNAENVLRNLSTPIVLSSLTTASAFMSLLFINSKVLNDLGIFASISVLSAALFTLLILPHLFSSKMKRYQQSRLSVIGKAASIDLSRKKRVVLSVVGITILFFFISHRVAFKADMTSFNFMTGKTADAEKLLNKLTGNTGKSVYIVSTGKNLDQALKNNEITNATLSELYDKGVLKLPFNTGVLFLSSFEQQKSIDRWNYFWKERKEKVIESLLKHGREFHFKPETFDDIIAVINKQYEPVKFNELPVVKTIFEDKLIETDSLSAVINVLNVPLNKFPQIQDAFSKEQDIWVINRQMVTEQLVSLLKDNLNKLVWFSILIIFVILMIAYGRIELTLITMTPMMLSWFWVTGIMSVAGISFNIFNIIIITFIFGLGVDYSIFLMRGMLLDYKYGNVNLKSYRVSIMLSVITTLLGIGVLIFAKHPALQSIALMSIIGILSVVLITFTIEPLLFRWLTTYSKGKRKRPVTALDFLFSIYSGILFIGGGAVLSMIAMILTILPGNEKKKKFFFHKIFKYATKALIWSNFLTPKKIINEHGEDFSKPAIVIANHQSHIDLMILLLQTPKIAVFTNKDNYNNKVYGRALKYAGFIPAYTGHEDALKKLKNLVKDGYSLAIFPEGHRSDDGKIRRFHKGAFYLAQELDLEIVPMIIFGPNELLKKSELFLKRGKITVKIYPRLNLSGNQWGSDLREKKYNIQEWFRAEYAGLVDKERTTAYLSDFIIKNYLYKGPVLEWYTRIKIKLEQNYSFFDDIIPKDAVVTDLGCGYGYLDFMLAMRSEERTVYGYDYDENKIKTANNCAIVSTNVSFSCADITKLELENSDVFVLNDVLHYLPLNMQEKVIKRCMLKLKEGGLIVIRDGNKELKKRHKGTRLTELFSTKTGFNKAENRLEFISESFLRDLVDLTKFDFEPVDKTRLTSNIVFLIKKR